MPQSDLVPLQQILQVPNEVAQTRASKFCQLNTREYLSTLTTLKTCKDPQSSQELRERSTKAKTSNSKNIHKAPQTPLNTARKLFNNLENLQHPQPVVGTPLVRVF